MPIQPKQIEENIHKLMADHRIPGLAMAVISDQSVIYTQGFGVTSVEDGGTAVTPQTLFRIGSTTKPMTGTLVMRLVEAGLLDLDEPIVSWLPDLQLSDAAAARKVTLRHILSHSAGLPSDFSVTGSRDPGGLAEHVSRDFPNYKLIAPPGKLFSYSNPGINLAGRVAEAVTGKPFGQLMTEYLFQPLQMKRSTFDLTNASTYPLALPHQVGEDGLLHVEHMLIDNTAYNPSGLGFSTANDLAQFAIMHLNSGQYQGQQLLQPPTIQEMQRIQMPIYGLATRRGVETYQRTGYGLTFFIAELDQQRWVSHTGGISSYVVFFELLPGEKIACIMLANGGAVAMDAGDFFDPIFSSLLSRSFIIPTMQEQAPKRNLWSLYTGRYVGANGLVQINITDDQLMAEINGEPVCLNALAEDFYIGNTSTPDRHHSIGFVPEQASQQGAQVEFIVVDGNIYQRSDENDLFQVDPAQLSRFSGRYHNGVAGDVVITCADQRLLFHLVKIDRTEPYIALSETAFTGSFGPLVFEIDPVGNVASFKINDSYVFSRAASE